MRGGASYKISVVSELCANAIVGATARVLHLLFATMVSARTPTRPDPPTGGRLNMLLTYGGWRSHSWADSLPALLTPMGVQTWRANSGAEAAALLKDRPDMHIAVVDLRLPLNGGEPRNAASAAAAEGGARILTLLQRLENPAPIIVVKPVRGAREDARRLAEALKCGVFAVVDRPVNLETMLEVLRRALRRHYQDRWPAA